MSFAKGWTQRNEQGDITGISGVLNDVFTELHPEFKNLRLSVKYIPKENRSNDKSPAWDFTLYKPQPKTDKNQAAGRNQQRYGETELTPEAPKRPPYGTQTQMQTQFANAADFPPDDEEIPF